MLPTFLIRDALLRHHHRADEPVKPTTASGPALLGVGAVRPAGSSARP
jgi:hypothetical protein